MLYNLQKSSSWKHDYFWYVICQTTYFSTHLEPQFDVHQHRHVNFMLMIVSKRLHKINLRKFRTIIMMRHFPAFATTLEKVMLPPLITLHSTRCSKDHPLIGIT